MRAPDRYVVANMGPHGRVKACRKRVYTSYGDAARVTQRCSRSRQAEGKPCFLLQGMPGNEKIVGRCDAGKCGRPKDGDQLVINRCVPDYVAKKSRRDLIKTRSKLPESARMHHTGASQASKSGVRVRRGRA